MSEWQPIETAPMDGTPILLYGPYEDISVAKWGPGWSCLADGRHAIAWQSDFGTEYIDFSCPTHWMPLPEAPSPSVVEGGR